MTDAAGLRSLCGECGATVDIPNPLAAPPSEALREQIVVEMENEGVVTWGDPGHRARPPPPATPDARPLDHGYSPRPSWAGTCPRCGAEPGENCAVLIATPDASAL